MDIKTWDRGLIADDEHGYPDDRSGFFSTTAVCDIFGYPMATLQQWLKDGFIRPAYRVEYGRGMRSVFVRSQLLWIGVFKTLVDRGIQRKLAVNWANAFFNMLKKEGKFDTYDLLVVEIDHNGIKGITLFSGEVHIKATKDGHDLLVINLSRIVEKIRIYT